MYKNYYNGKDLKTIISSASELLIEFVGEKQQKQILEPILCKYNLKNEI